MQGSNLKKAIVIGASTGGPEVLHSVIKVLPADLPFPVFVAQHMMPEFMESFAESLNHESLAMVELGGQDQIVEDSIIYIAPGGCDMKVVQCADGKIRLITIPPLSILQPSVDVLMASVATVYKGGCLGIVMTGMGKDGLEGMRAIKAVGGHTLVQDEATSTVYGMAKAVNDEHLADMVLPITAISAAITRFGNDL
jgi:two-component system chemotaxis response regulator CheB